VKIHGTSDRFALGFELVPDRDEGGSPLDRSSWGRLQVWVSGRNLTSGRLDSGEVSAAAPDAGETVEHATVPLAPLARWVAEHWDPLFHEGHLPTQTNAMSAAAWYIRSVEDPPEDDDAFDAFMAAREAWWSRHGMGAALPGYRIPDLIIRRVHSGVELSWSHHEWSGVPRGVRLTHGSGAAVLPADEVAAVFHAWAESVVDALRSFPEAAEFCERTSALLEGHRAAPSPLERLKWAAGPSVEKTIRDRYRRAGVAIDDIDAAARTLLGLSAVQSMELVTPLTVPAMLFRSASPSMSSADLALLSGSFWRLEPALDEPLRTLQHGSPLPLDREAATRDGYDKARLVRSALSIEHDVPLLGRYDLETEVLPQLGVAVHDFTFDDSQVDGVAIFAPGRRPMIGVNLSGRFSSTVWGRRMTLAHELCHLLYDLGDNGGVGIVSNPWAPYLLERRANAFAAMLLMPREVLDATLPPDPRHWTPELMRAAMNTLGVGRSALTWHLYNLNRISDSERQAWLDVL
jgi:Zn-dependent peptidase ImmA (M78 family)